MALRQYAVCRLSEAQCLQERCPLADQLEGAWSGCRDGWLRWEDQIPPRLTAIGKARLNLYLRLQQSPIPEEVRFASILARG